MQSIRKTIYYNLGKCDFWFQYQHGSRAYYDTNNVKIEIDQSHSPNQPLTPKVFLK